MNVGDAGDCALEFRVRVQLIRRLSDSLSTLSSRRPSYTDRAPDKPENKPFYRSLRTNSREFLLSPVLLSMDRNCRGS